MTEGKSKINIAPHNQISEVQLTEFMDQYFWHKTMKLCDDLNNR